ncbi:FG-GAP-like repeat-containing protein [Bacteroidota bacterium]
MKRKCKARSGFLLKIIFLLIPCIAFSQENKDKGLGSQVNKTDNISFSRGSQSLGNLLSFGIGTADFDMDNDIDIFMTNYNGLCKLWLNDGSGIFFPSGEFFDAIGIHDVGIGDLNADTFPDIFVVSHGGYNKVFLNNGSGNFTESGQNIGSPNFHPQTIQLADVDADNDIDALIYNSDAPNRIWLNNGNGIFDMVNIDFGGNDASRMIMADFNGDSFPDIFFSMRTQANQVWMNDGAGHFSVSSQPIGAGGEGLDCQDVDGDGDVDIVVANPDRIWIYYNQNNTGTFVAQSDFSEGAFQCKLFDADFDDDYDLITLDLEDGAKLWINNGLGSFSSTGSIFGNSIFHRVAYQKLDSDDDYDLIFSKEDGTEIFFNDYIITGINDINNTINNDIKLKNYPNPFKNFTTITYQLTDQSNILLKVFDVSGKLVSTMINREQMPGKNYIKFNSDNLPGGIYYYQISTPGFSETSTMLISK